MLYRHDDVCQLHEDRGASTALHRDGLQWLRVLGESGCSTFVLRSKSRGEIATVLDGATVQHYPTSSSRGAWSGEDHSITPGLGWTPPPVR